ncbi:hypothetical protein [Actinoplanes solisilvae]|uniref:hypothetical protein n=1 Tax=Actinoplanes solisilvae TaxID=2486853 RepID=UPI000FD7CC6D|nr:hypothetical protein [Actinoplanes solisilvae]
MSTDPEGRPPRRGPVAMFRHFTEWMLRRPAEPARLAFQPMERVGDRYTIAPTLYEAPHELRRRIDDLAGAGALDEGNGHVFNATIRSWVEQWCDQIEDEYDEQAVELRLRLAEAEADIERRTYLAELADRQLEEADQRLRRLRDEFRTGRPASPARTPGSNHRQRKQERHRSQQHG